MKKPTIEQLIAYMRGEKVKHTEPHQVYYDENIAKLQELQRREKGCEECNPYCVGCDNHHTMPYKCDMCIGDSEFEESNEPHDNFCGNCGRDLRED